MIIQQNTTKKNKSANCVFRKEHRESEERKKWLLLDRLSVCVFDFEQRDLSKENACEVK